MISLNNALEYVKEKFKGQTDKQGVDYYKHCEAVMLLLPKWAPIEWKLAALGHDLIEDLHVTDDELKEKGFPEDSIRIIHIVSRNGYDHLSYIEWIRHIVSQGNLGAMYVKLADLTHNSDPSRSLSDCLNWMIQRYKRAIVIITKAIASYDNRT